MSSQSTQKFPSAERYVCQSSNETLWENKKLCEDAFREFGQALLEYPTDKTVIHPEGWKHDLRAFYELEENLYNKNNPSAKREPLTQEAANQQLLQRYIVFQVFAAAINVTYEVDIAKLTNDVEKRKKLLEQQEHAKGLSFEDWMKVALRIGFDILDPCDEITVDFLETIQKHET